MAAGVLFVKEAGGRVSDFSGTASTIYTKQVLASNGLLHDAMVGILQKGLKH
jgi:myo-inositol-1(or 4)-monophosphatase